MVNNEGQLYTMEGIAAALLILFTTYVVLTSTTIITPGETHISDMQLETLGNDVLAIMDTPLSYDPVAKQFTPSELETYVNTGDRTAFNSRFLELSNAMYDVNIPGIKSDRINYNAKVYFRKSNDGVDFVPFSGSQNYRENSVVVTRWVNTETGFINPELIRQVPQTVLLEVTLWRE